MDFQPLGLRRCFSCEKVECMRVLPCPWKVCGGFLSVVRCRSCKLSNSYDPASTWCLSRSEIGHQYLCIWTPVPSLIDHWRMPFSTFFSRIDLLLYHFPTSFLCERFYAEETKSSIFLPVLPILRIDVSSFWGLLSRLTFCFSELVSHQPIVASIHPSIDRPSLRRSIHQAVSRSATMAAELSVSDFFHTVTQSGSQRCLGKILGLYQWALIATREQWIRKNAK